MEVPKGIVHYAAVTGLAVLIACSDGGTSPSLRPSQASHSISAATLTGRIVYTLGGTLHIYNVATKADVSIGISGVNPKFSPDGTLITYQGGGGVSVVNSNGTNNRLVVANGATPSFDPTGTMIAYGNGGIWKINLDGTGNTRLTTAGIQASWSPDGSQISYSTGVGGVSQLFIMNADGTNAHQALTSAAIIDPVWRPSNRIVFGLMTAKGRQSDYELNSFDPVTGNLTRLTTNSGADDEPSWSPDATGISWTSGLGGIWIMNADGSSPQIAIASSKARQGSWSK